MSYSKQHETSEELSNYLKTGSTAGEQFKSSQQPCFSFVNPNNVFIDKCRKELY